MAKKVIGGRIFGLRNLNVVVMQTEKGMAVVSRHRTLIKAQIVAEWHASRSEKAMFAALELVGNPTCDYRPGDFLNTGNSGDWTANDVIWKKVPACCSECCDNYRPDGLNYRCPGTHGNPICDTIAAVRLLPKRVKPCG